MVDNRPGAGSAVATDAVATSAPDGYTLLLMSNTHTVNESRIPNKPFALMCDFVAVAPSNFSDLVLVANPALPASSVKELPAQANSKPGKFHYASSGNRTPHHVAGELFQAMASASPCALRLDIDHARMHAFARPHFRQSAALSGLR